MSSPDAFLGPSRKSLSHNTGSSCVSISSKRWHCRHPFLFELALEQLKLRHRRRMVQPGARSWRCFRRPTCGGRIQCIDSLMPEPGDFVMYQVAADHAFRQTDLVGLIDHPAVAHEVRGAALDELAQQHLLFDASAFGVSHTDDVLSVGELASAELCSLHRMSAASATFHTPSPPLPRYCFRTRAAPEASRRAAPDGDQPCCGTRGYRIPSRYPGCDKALPLFRASE